MSRCGRGNANNGKVSCWFDHSSTCTRFKKTDFVVRFSFQNLNLEAEVEGGESKHTRLATKKNDNILVSSVDFVRATKVSGCE